MPRKITAATKEEPPRPIGVFDSGVGGLTVVAELRKLLPNESIFYIGDTARVPMTPTFPFRVAFTAASAPGRMTPMTGTRSVSSSD